MSTYFVCVEMSGSHEIAESLHVDLREMGFISNIDTEGGRKQLPFKCYVKQDAPESLNEISERVQRLTRSTADNKMRVIVIEASGFQVWEGT